MRRNIEILQVTTLSHTGPASCDCCRQFRASSFVSRCCSLSSGQRCVCVGVGWPVLDSTRNKQGQTSGVCWWLDAIVRVPLFIVRWHFCVSKQAADEHGMRKTLCIQCTRATGPPNQRSFASKGESISQEGCSLPAYSSLDPGGHADCEKTRQRRQQQR